MDVNSLKRGEQELVSGCALFKSTDDRLVARALTDQRCHLIKLAKGNVIFNVYDYRQNLGLVLAGSIAVTKPISSRYVMNTLKRGSLFGSADLYDNDTEVVTVLTALSPCRIVFFPRDLLEGLILEEKEVALNYIRFLTSRVRFLNEKIQGLVSGSAEEALRQYLVTNALQNETQLTVRLAGSISALAEALNIGRASLYRAFDTLENAGHIKRNGKVIQILNLDGLSTME